jgi:O-antigen ligase
MLNTSTDSSNQGRLVMLRTGLNMIAANPFLGVGPERIFTEFLRYKPPELPLPDAWYGHLHNNYLQLAAERGLPCLLFWLWALFEVFLLSLALARSPTNDGRVLGHAAVAMTIGLMVAGLFEFNLGDSEIMMPYLFLLGAAFAWTRLEPAKPRPGDALPVPSALSHPVR